MTRLFSWALALAAVSSLLSPVSAADAWAELAKPGAVVLFRHANAPGVGDPFGFKAGDCATQRNLDDRGRTDARLIGDKFRSRQINVGAVLSSSWCRTRETASLAFGDGVRVEPAFDSFFQRAPQARKEQTAQAREILSNWRGPGVLVVVTHQVNISALTGAGAMSGEGVVVRPRPDGSFKVVATIQP